MKSSALPKNIEQVFESENIDSILSTLTREIVDLLQCDRCFIYMRDPETRLAKAAFCYCRDREAYPEGNRTIPDLTNNNNNKWSPESSAIAAQDPMLAAALNCQPHIFVEDVETAAPNIVNLEFEQENFGHRALIHAHLCHEGQLWGVLQPSVFSKPRTWSKSDRQLITDLAKRITPLVKEYIQREIQLITY